MNTTILRIRLASSVCARCLFRSQGIAARLLAAPSSRIAPRSIVVADRRNFTTSLKRLASTSLNDQRITDPLQDYRAHYGCIRSLSQAIGSRLTSTSAPSEDEVLTALQAYKEYAQQQRINPHAVKSQQRNPTAAILSLDDTSDATRSTASESVISPQKSPISDTATVKEAREISQLAFGILTNPAVFITEPILSAYVDLSLALGNLSSIASAFTLYAEKPYLRPGAKNFTQPNPSFPRYAIPDAVAAKALDSAIKAKNMELALKIISSSYGAPAYKNNKLLRRALPAGAVAVASPVAAYVLAEQLSNLQDVVQHDIAVKFAFAGLMAYIGVSATLGIVALATANDQMRRVTWLVGTPLGRRWLWEEERAAYDKVAQAWGFQEPHNYGFEEGPEWELLRESAARRSMILDNPALLEGMQ